MARTLVQVDGGYVDAIMRESFGGARIDYLKLVKEVLAGDELIRTYYYHCEPYQGSPPTGVQRKMVASFQRFISHLERLPGFEVRLGRLIPTRHGFKQKGVDVMMAVDLVRLSLIHRIDKAILVTGDSDFIPAIQVAKDAGVVMYLAFHPSREVQPNFRNVADYRIPIDRDFVNNILRD